MSVRWFFRVEYDGSAFCGWQIQENVDSVQSALEKAFFTILRVPVRVVGAGRTDSGVHSRGIGAHVDVPETADIVKCSYAINGILPFEIAVHDFRIVDSQFHARFSACERQYRYTVVTRKSPLMRKHAWYVALPVDWENVQQQCGHILGKHDFSTFCAAGHSPYSMVCSVSQVSLIDKGAGQWEFFIAADRFVYRMVRSLVGTLIDIGHGKITQSMIDLINACDRSLAGATAPPHGLVMEYVKYGESL
jgi:tRNA pseudouridine38-40 synthase